MALKPSGRVGEARLFVLKAKINAPPNAREAMNPRQNLRAAQFVRPPPHIQRPGLAGVKSAIRVLGPLNMDPSSFPLAQLLERWSIRSHDVHEARATP
jgi:hypothetical protein